MREKLRSHLTYANVISTVALFLVLGGGTSLAMNGGNFILGQQNGAGNPTQLTSPTTDPAGALKVTSTATSGGRAIQGTSAHGQGVYGHSGSNAGVVGDSSTFDGVFGVSNDNNSAGVSGHGDGGGFGVFATGGNTLFNTSAVHGQSAAGNGVEGISGRDIASGVYGQNNSTGYGVAGRANSGTGVLGDSSGGWAFKASGNTTQSRAKGGFVKAMAYVNPNSTVGDFIERCFSSQRPAAQATSGDCGFTFSKGTTGVYSLDFGFQVSDRFILAQVQRQQTGWGVTVGPATQDGTGVPVYVDNGVGAANSPFFIIVF